MHSMEEKFKYFMKVQKELYDIIEDAMNLDITIIVKMMMKHVESYNIRTRCIDFH